MKKNLLFIIICLTLFLSCSSQETPLIGIGTGYWDGKYSINKSYIDAIRENGGRIRLIPCTEDEQLLLQEIKELDGFVFAGGRDYIPEWYGKEMHPSMTVMDMHRARFDSLFMTLALESGKPILGICAGEQLLNIITGGKLIQNIPNHRGVEHMITIEKDSKLYEIFGDNLMVNSSHHQCVDPNFIGNNLIITARSADSIVECLEYQGDQWIVGVQFHPERMAVELRDKLFSFFIQETK
ncbi:MAG: gamma-glutamyl-gamma-aminobutyrate hydrolase family protein [Candidatus Marinimicrobia bacterium]|nr:gamma-glutamyl-gamma-aminobutyrate hydrolase family protein [Candidatus Neomarinimicrobiota bacterium]